MRNSRLLGEGPVVLFHRIVDAMVDHYGPEVEKLEERLDALEQAIFDEPDRSLARRILKAKRDVASLRRIISPQRDVISRLARREFVDISTEMSFRFRDVYDHLVRIADDALIFQDRLTGILDAHLSIVSNQLNEVMKVLAVVSTIFMPLTLVTGVYGMNMPLPHFPGGDRHAVLVAHRRQRRSRRRHARSSSAAHAGSDVGRITRFPADLANQIAAGEVVERPASVVKELVENAIDAGATRIAIHVELGGKKQVRVEDDGEGMEPDDARLAIERHATSKIRSSDDLAAIRTLGFRGEALPSIASVSHFVLRTRARGQQIGNGDSRQRRDDRVGGRGRRSGRHADRGERRLLQPAGAPQVSEVRRRRVGAGVAHHHAAGAGVSRGRLHADERRPVGAAVSARGVAARSAVSAVRRAWRSHRASAKEAGGLRLTGYIAALAEQGPTRGPQNVFINRRIVKDRTIAHAIIDAYSQASIKERSPEVHLFIEMAPDAVDVNVHPTKAEVRFRDQSLVHEVVRRALMDALGQGGVPQLQLRPEIGEPDGGRGHASRRPRRRRVSEPLGAGRGRADAADRGAADGRSAADRAGS